MKQYKGIVGNDGTFRHLTHDDNGSSMWVYSSEGYLQQEMYYLNVFNGKTLVLSTTPVTKWDLVEDGEGESMRKRFRLRGSTKILGLDGSNKVILAETPANKYAACTLTVTENNSKWEGPKDVSWEVQSPQLVTYLRTYFLRNITVKIDKNDAGTENVEVVKAADSRCYCSLSYDDTQLDPTGRGNKWDINTNTGVIYNTSTDNKQQTVEASYTLTPINPLVLADHPASKETITIKVNAKALTPDATKKYLLFNTQDENYRFPKVASSITEDALLPVDGKQSDLTEDVKGEIAWEVEVDAEGFYSFKNVLTNRYLYYDAGDYTVSDYGAVKIGATDLPSDDTKYKYKFRIYSSAGSRDPFGNCLYIIPYEKQFAVWKKDGVLGELYFALYMNTSGNTKIASIYKTSDDAKWKIYAYEWEYRLWDNWSISGDQHLYATGNHSYTASTCFSRNIKDSPKNTEHLMLPGSKTHEGITYTWTLTGLTDYISTSYVQESGTSTLTAAVNSLPSGTRSGTLTVKASISSPASNDNSKSIPVSLYNLNPTLSEITSLSEITDVNGLYKLTENNTYSSTNKPVANFSGTLDGGGCTISGLTAPLFTTLDGGTVRNLNIDNVTITSGDSDGNTGAIACVATGAARIYNCGILATISSTVSGSGYTGGLVGKLDGEARVVNCFSYANITGGTTVGGIVGFNNVSTDSRADKIKTMVMNCMFYGDITGGTSKAPIYNGNIISNKDANGVSNYNYFWGGASYVQPTGVTYNCALMAETRFLQRFEFFRHLLNSHRELAAWWATGSTANKDQMMKWVLEPSQIGSSTPYPILKTPGKYPSVVNIDADHATTQTERNKGGLLGTLSVTIDMGSGGAQFAPPTSASITTSSLTLNITDKDPEHFNFNYGKVQLPYYNDVGTKNYTGNRVVTGWKITSITGGTKGSFTTGDDAEADADGKITKAPYNFADRKCTDKDLYSVSGRVFNQGAYWDVPEGVTAITIEPYWAKAAYLADAYVDVVYNQAMSTAYNVPNVGGGQIYANNQNYNIAGENQKVYTAVGNAREALSLNSNYTVYDYAIVLVGNAHNIGVSSNNSGHRYTLMSADFDHDNEPDYSYILRYNGRCETHPVRVDFLNIPGLGMAQKSTGSNGSYNFGIMQPVGWFEATNTSLFRVTQFEYDRSNRGEAPLILQGGVMEQWVSGQNNGVANKTTYYHVGGNVWFKEFHRGTHQDNTLQSKHPPISVTGGDFEEFYLTGLYRSDVSNYNDNAECYINGGRFGILAGAGQEGLGDASKNTGNVTWQIDHADIDEFYGGGINKDMEGNITTVISNSHVGRFCGGPKFGDMSTGKTVVTTALGCTFGTYFGAGYGGNSYSREAPTNRSSNIVNTDWNNWIKANYKQEYKADFNGVSTQFNYQFLPLSDNTTNVARIFIEYVKFSLATCRAVTSTLTDCTVTGNFYGGGSLGKVDGNVTSTLTDCTVNGSAYGAGYSASLPDVMVDAVGFEVEPYYYDQLGSYRTGVKYAENDSYKPEKYTWEHGNTISINKLNNILYTTEDLTTLGTVTGKATLNIFGTTTVAGSIYGGGEESGVDGDTEVNVTGGTVGNATNGDADHGNIYGGGKGKANDITAGLVKGNTTISVSQAEGSTTRIYHNVYGGGAYGSVGTFTYDADDTNEIKDGKPVSCATDKGKCTITVSGGEIGKSGLKMDHGDEGVTPPDDYGYVFGGGRGEVADPATYKNVEFMAYVDKTDVTISGNAFVTGAVYGGSESGHVLHDTKVTIKENCQIGCGDGMTSAYSAEDWNKTSLKPCNSWPFQENGHPYDPYAKTNGNYADGSSAEDGWPTATDGHTFFGNVFGGGSGYYPYAPGKWLRSAGIVEGNTVIDIQGGHILSNVYGGCEMADVTGSATITMSGGTVGVPRTSGEIAADPDLGHLFGAGKGDKRIFFNTSTNVASTSVTVTGGKVYGSVYGGGEDGHVLGNAVTTISQAEGKTTLVGCDGVSGFDGNVFGGGQGSVTAKTAGVVGGNVTLNIQGGEMKGSVYGGGRLASVGTFFAMVTNADGTPNTNYGKMQDGDDHGVIAINMTGGTVNQNVYGGCMGTLSEAAGTKADQEDYGVSKNVTIKLNENVGDDAKGCAVKGSIYGCNNVNSSPQGSVSVYVYKTQRAGKARITNTEEVTDAKVDGTETDGEFDLSTFDVQAVYGGGNLAAYKPVITSDNINDMHTSVIIDGCGRTSIGQVYGGGNAATTPATSVVVKGTYEIGELFGGGNGKGMISLDGGKTYVANPGANVGYYDYHDVEDQFDTKDERSGDGFADYRYGSGKASVTIEGGKIHRVFGGSNTKGNVRISAVTMLEEKKDGEDEAICPLQIDEAYGGGKSAPMDAEAQLHMACIPGLRAAYGGAEAADIQGNVTLTITNGTFDRVFGGNNVSGTINGDIKINIEETGCKPIIIGELYGGGNQAAYSIYGYKEDAATGKIVPIESKTDEAALTTPYNNPEVNIKSFTSIGEVYGGGLGSTATMVGSPTVNINVALGDYNTTVVGEGAKTKSDANGKPVPTHASGKIGAINNVYGGGNEAKVIGDTNVNIGTEATVTYESATDDPETTDVDESVHTVIGADIRGNVYGGGNKAEVTGNTNVTIGKDTITETPSGE
ncbi:MAG: hypothetical protein IJ580_06175 [Prevotella sp.]|nr:hypothetical protein [Prevotella sp.]